MFEKKCSCPQKGQETSQRETFKGTFGGKQNRGKREIFTNILTIKKKIWNIMKVRDLMIYSFLSDSKKECKNTKLSLNVETSITKAQQMDKMHQWLNQIEKLTWNPKQHGAFNYAVNNSLLHVSHQFCTTTHTCTLFIFIIIAETQPTCTFKWSNRDSAQMVKLGRF